MNYESITALTVFALVAAMTPGPNTLMLLTSGANFGFMRSLPHISGVLGGFAIMVVLVGVGLMQLFNAFPVSYLVLKFASIAYLLFLAWKIATASKPDDGGGDEGEQIVQGKPFTLLQAALFQWVNPKAWAVVLAALSAYTPPSRPLSGVFLVMLIFTLVNVLSACTWTVAGVQARRLLSEPLKLRVFNVTMALLLVATLYPILFDRI